jgi:hypothetical protein
VKKTAFGIVLAVAGLAVSAALAAPPPGKNKHESTTGTSSTTTTTTDSHKGKPATGDPTCRRPLVAVILRGTLTADGAAAPTTLSVNVTGGNRWGRAYKLATQPVPVDVTSTTRINRKGDHDPSHLLNTDRVNIQARVCKALLKDGGAPALTARRVVAHPAQAAPKTDTTETTTTTSDSSGD